MSAPGKISTPTIQVPQSSDQPRSSTSESAPLFSHEHLSTPIDGDDRDEWTSPSTRRIHLLRIAIPALLLLNVLVLLVINIVRCGARCGWSVPIATVTPVAFVWNLLVLLLTATRHKEKMRTEFYPLILLVDLELLLALVIGGACDVRTGYWYALHLRFIGLVEMVIGLVYLALFVLGCRAYRRFRKDEGQIRI